MSTEFLHLLSVMQGQILKVWNLKIVATHMRDWGYTFKRSFTQVLYFAEAEYLRLLATWWTCGGPEEIKSTKEWQALSLRRDKDGFLLYLVDGTSIITSWIKNKVAKSSFVVDLPNWLYNIVYYAVMIPLSVRYEIMLHSTVYYWYITLMCTGINKQ